jgi:hypothetical protein
MQFLGVLSPLQTSDQVLSPLPVVGGPWFGESSVGPGKVHSDVKANVEERSWQMDR